MDSEFEQQQRRQLLSTGVKTRDFRRAAAMVRADFGARSHRGRAGAENDDHYLVVRLERWQEILMTSLASADLPGGLNEQAYAAVVADGIGRAGSGSLVLLCTNGLTDVVSDDDIAEVLASRRTPVEQCDVLLDKALTNDSRDNTTVVLANYHVAEFDAEAT